MWDFSVIKEILMNPVYIGAIASQKVYYNFKIGVIGDKKPNEWIVVEGCHEPIIDKNSFNILQEKLKSRQRSRKNGKISLFAGLIKCGECGKALVIRTTHDKNPKKIYACKTYNSFGKKHCTQHRIDFDTLYSLVLNKIRECAKAALYDKENTAGKLSAICESGQKTGRESLEKSLSKDKERVKVLEKMIVKLYEDMAEGRINDQNFNLILGKTQKEQEELKDKINKNSKLLSDKKQLVHDIKKWKAIIQEYADISELDAVILNRLIKKIIVHEKIDDDKIRHISIEIHFNLKPIPEIEQVEN